MFSLATFIRLWIWFSIRRLRSHLWRTLAVLLGIALGAAVFTSVRLAVEASLDSFTKSVDALSGKADWTVVCPGGRVPENLIAELIRNPAVDAASPLSTAYVQAEQSSAELFLLIGLDPILDRALRNWQGEPPPASPSSSTSAPALRPSKTENRNPKSLWLSLMAEPFTMIAGDQLYDSLHLEAGSELFLNHPHGRSCFRVLGRLARKDVALAEGGRIAVTDLATFQEFTGTCGMVDRIDLRLKHSTPAGALERIRAELPRGVILERPSEFKESGTLMVRSYQLNLSVLSFVSLFVGMFLVYSLISLHAISRRSELAILRSLGASSRMVFLLFLTEGAFFGVAGWLLAVPLGSLIVRHLLGHISSTISLLLVRVQVDRLVLDSGELLFSFVTTLLVSLLAAWQPAYEAMQVPPREVFQAQAGGDRQNDRVKRPAVFGIILVSLVWPLCRLPATSGVAFPGYVATFFLFSGFSLISPWVLQGLGRLLPPVLRRVAGEPAYLGGRQIRDAGTRVAVSVGALITAMALFVALVIMIHSFRKTVELWVSQCFSGDLFLRPKMAAVNQYRDVLPAEVVAVLKQFEEEADLIPYRRIALRYGNVPFQFEALDLEGFTRQGGFLFLTGDPSQVLPQAKQGQGVIVSEVFANQTGVSLGQRFQSQIGQMRLDLPVLGIIRDYRTQGGVVYYSLRHFEELSRDSGWSGVRFNLSQQVKAGGVDAQIFQNRVLQALGPAQSGLEVMLGADLRRSILKIFDETFAVTTVLLLIALLVATLGITSTLTVLILDRTRQFLTTLACGGTREQIRQMIVWEALIMVFTGELLGLACGFILSSLLVHVINRQSFGWTFLYAVDWSALLPAFPLILVTALLAAFPSSQIVFRTSPARVLRDG